MGYVHSTGRGRIIWCRCGGAEVLPPLTRMSWREKNWTEEQYEVERAAYTAAQQTFTALHQHGLGEHRHVSDNYRALCRPALFGCRNCGSMPTGRLQFYCSAECRESFDRNHFWGAARNDAIIRASTFFITTHRTWRGTRSGIDRTYCWRCAEPCVPEVNHIVPVNGRRPMFGCEHHQENLEVLCHRCHLDVTAEQRRSGLIGKGAA